MSQVHVIIDGKDLEERYIILGVGNLVQEKNWTGTKSSNNFLLSFYLIKSP